jgi:uncharacterized protein (DUF885 family)
MEHDVSAAQFALSQLAGLEGLDAAFLRDHLQQEAAEAQRFWYRFPVTPYNASALGAYRSEILAVAGLSTAADADRYLELLDDYVALVEQLGKTLAAQRARGIRLPAWAVAAVMATVGGHADASAELMVAPERLTKLAAGPAGRLADGVGRVVAGRLAAAWRRLMDSLEADAREGGDGVGIGQYPGGEDCYTGLIRLHTGLDLSAEQVHAIGLAEVDRITERIHEELGITDEPGYRQRLADDPGMYASTPAEVERRFQQHIDRAMAELPSYFGCLPAAPFRLRPLAASLSGLTYGYYEPPGTDGVGYYHYNVADLPQRPLVQAASVIYHEGMPGHHLQIGRQFENMALHPIRRELSELRTFALNGYVEGWAEYAAGFCDEIGLYANPLDRYGRLSSERFQAARLVVDTGLNVLGWSCERAAAYISAGGFLSGIEVSSEVLRYAVDDPAQALAYHLGHWHLRRLRGTRDPRQFHEAVLDHGPLPLTLLDSQLHR